MIDGEAELEECRRLSDAELLAQVRTLARDERAREIKILARLAELGKRELAERTGYSSLFQFCVRDLKFCEGSAYHRTHAAKACARFSKLLELIESGEVSVVAASLMAEHLTFENHQTLLRQAKGASRREMERILAGLAPTAKPPERARVIAVAAVATGPSTAAPGPDELPLGQTASERQHDSKIVIRTEHSFSFGDASEAKLARARELLAHKCPMGDIESIFDVALDALLEKIDPELKKTRARPDRGPRTAEAETRRIPNWVKRKVRERDGDRCSFVSADGVKCGEKKFLQFDHVVPWSLGGSSDDPDNIRQLCASHNQWLAKRLDDASSLGRGLPS